MKKRIYLSPPHMGGDEFIYVKEAFATNYIAPVGPQIDAFEKEFGEIVGSKYAVATSSGTAALHLALRYVGVEPGDEVFCSTLTFVASANAILYLNAKPVFIDSEISSWNMNPELLKQSLKAKAAKNKLPKAIVLVHLYGQCADIDPIKEICDRYDVAIIEDAAEALGATHRGKAAGSFGKAGIFSFNGNKIITTSGGGMLVSDDKALIDKARFWATQARDDAPHYEHSELGYNYRMSNVLAGIGRGQLRVLKDRVNRKREIFDYYSEGLANIPGITFMPEPVWGRSTRWLTCLTIDPELFGKDSEYIRLALENENIEARPVWKPMHMQPLFSDCEIVGGEVSEELFRNGLCLPSGTAMTREDIDRIISVILGCHGQNPHL
ncbi:MAG: aminotransferase class I/II-fold pyridoxal phosphate-dependent enzyme [Proteobacteria bacterium]|nr:aminotransferase class I/II-fold pyridoxal phosphate-dependent enzyme [Pseudomonadota bacterium]